jgi:hypothetical protein
MEFNLLKTIEKPLTYFRPNEAILQSPFPSRDFVNPGVGNVIKSYSIFVPLHTYNYLHRLQKTNEADQLGFGSPLSSSDGSAAGSAQSVAYSRIPEKYTASPSTPLIPADTKLTISSISDIPDEIQSTNDKKRKLVGEDIFEQFMHPKIKTSKLEIENKVKVAPAAAYKVLPKKPSAEHKHKFKLH